jgi:hypothetical protein
VERLYARMTNRVAKPRPANGPAASDGLLAWDPVI